MWKTGSSAHPCAPSCTPPRRLTRNPNPTTPLSTSTTSSWRWRESGVAKAALSDPWNAASRREWRNRQWGSAASRHLGSAADFAQAAFFDALYGAGEPLDLSRYFLVIPDAIGAGESSKPSDGLRTHFPHYGYKDQVRAQHLLLERIGIKHLKLVLGTSMGGMQTWLWGEMFRTTWMASWRSPVRLLRSAEGT